MTNEQKEALADWIKTASGTMESHKRALERLQENEEAAHRKFTEFATVLEEHTKLLVKIQEVWTTNFDEMGKLLNAQTRMLETMRALVLPPDAVN